ncbi:hypothetical protein CA850_00960 [Micromonospora echinospora]|uniref:SH3 domain-containing protein n=1 Tax=Micromonospora echinospora TaxID=1877 RepID=A0A1C4Y5L3_MICEC|nr:hypothetical protein [Micromonospora echinospora]OZV84458.1 hypothetical protein CA850_00960 [Micromonospora echinospora]SCF16017.1 hypothetical protein GA0070618_3612 [Micromonospora echinospora]
MKVAKSVGIALAALFGSVMFLAAPAAAAPAPAPAAAAVGEVGAQASFCATGRVESWATNLPIRAAASTAGALITTAQPGYQYNCDGTVTGQSVTACGVTSNVWVRIVFSGQWGYTYMACLNDV